MATKTANEYTERLHTPYLGLSSLLRRDISSFVVCQRLWDRQTWIAFLRPIHSQKADDCEQFGKWKEWLQAIQFSLCGSCNCLCELPRNLVKISWNNLFSLDRHRSDTAARPDWSPKLAALDVQTWLAFLLNYETSIVFGVHLSNGHKIASGRVSFSTNKFATADEIAGFLQKVQPFWAQHSSGRRVSRIHHHESSAFPPPPSPQPAFRLSRISEDDDNF